MYYRTRFCSVYRHANFDISEMLKKIRYNNLILYYERNKYTSTEAFFTQRPESRVLLLTPVTLIEHRLSNVIYHLKCSVDPKKLTT